MELATKTVHFLMYFLWGSNQRELPRETLLGFIKCTCHPSPLSVFFYSICTSVPHRGCDVLPNVYLTSHLPCHHIVRPAVLQDALAFWWQWLFGPLGPEKLRICLPFYPSIHPVPPSLHPSSPGVHVSPYPPLSQLVLSLLTLAIRWQQSTEYRKLCVCVCVYSVYYYIVISGGAANSRDQITLR